MAKARKKTARSKPTKKTSRPASFDFLNGSHATVRSHLKAAVDLPTFLASVGTLTLSSRKRLVEQARVLLESNYVHLPLKESMHGVDPVQRLRLIEHRLDQANSATMPSEYEFHREMLEVFNSVRDLHTNYLLPAPFNNKVAFLPFEVEEFFVNKKARWIASHFVQGFSPQHFKPGVEIVSWNGIPIARAIDVIADQHAGSNLAARHARGIQGLTIRPLRRSLPPNELFVLIGYKDLNGTERELRQEWLVSPPLPAANGNEPDSANVNSASLGVDLEMDIATRMKAILFAPNVVADAKKKKRKLSSRRAAAGQSVTSSMPDVFAARSVQTTVGTFGHIRIFTFSVNNPGAFVSEFVRLVELLPQEGLIIDVRGNGGGHIWASEGLLQVLTPREIEPEPTQFINTALNLKICKRHESNPVGIDLSPWVGSLEQATETGAIYSRGFPITPQEFANDRGQKYHGPAVLITDAKCYSATDIFAAGFQDHEIGPILGVDDNTGAGGANVWTHGLLRQLLQAPQPADPESPYNSLPSGAGMRVSIRRTLRVGERSGTPVEDLGVVPDERHFMTKNDLLNGNEDLLDAAGKLLDDMDVRALTVETTVNSGQLKIKVTTLGLDRVDAYLDDRPVETVDLDDGETTFIVDLPASSDLLELAGYFEDAYVAQRIVEI